MKKIQIITTILLLGLICLIGNSFFKYYQSKKFSNNYSISASLVIIDKEIATTIDLCSGEMRKMSIWDNEFTFPNDYIFTNKGEIYYYKNGNLKKMLSTNYEIESTPVIIGNSIYFVASELWDKTSHPNIYLWQYKEGTIKKFHPNNLDYSSDILTDSYNLFFVQKDGDFNYIIRKEIATGKTELLLSGYGICWKEIGKSFFYSPNDGGLAIYDIETKETIIINKEIDIMCSPLYSNTENVLLFYNYDKTWEWGYMIPWAAIYYLELNEYVYVDAYLNKMGFDYPKDFRISTPLSDVYWN